PLWNSYAFFATYAEIDRFDPMDPGVQTPLAERSVLDRWIISQLHLLIAEVRAALDGYDPDRAAHAIERFTIEELSNWYIRRNRRRFWKSESDRDKAAAYRTLYDALTTLTGLLAPFLPFLSEAMYQNLVRAVDPTAPESVHLTDYPTVDASSIDEQLSSDMAAVLEVVSLGRAARSEAGVKVRQPLPGILVHAREKSVLDAVTRLKDQVLDELNVKDVAPLVELGDVVAYDIRPKLAALGPKYGKRLGEIRQLLAQEAPVSVATRVEAGQTVDLTLSDGSTVALEPGEILVDLTKRAGYAAAQGSMATVVLDTSLTAELIQEGLARDFVRGIQDARRSAGYRIEDRIEITYVGDPEVIGALNAFASYVKTETLANQITGERTEGASDQVEPEAVAGPGGAFGMDGTYRDQIEVGRHQVRIALRRLGD
ncbi:MAG: isoleucyl-tRNA synthetase, partial [Thermomicrobiales bacterium]|nr:isoleucyl-tRNA synthetase [Thermomicrobiales bacterium]